MPGPVGAVTDFAGATAPTGWMLCYGQAVSRAGYPELFQTIGTTYGIGDGSTTYNLPDCRGRVTAGVDNMGGTAANRITSAGSGIAGTTLGAVGGAQAIIIGQTNLPPITPTFTGATQNWFSTQTNVAQYAGQQVSGTAGTGAAAFAGFTTSAVVTPVTPAGTIGSVGGSSTPLASMPPTIIFNKIIFAGRP